MADNVGFFQILNLERCEVLPAAAKNAADVATGYLVKLNSDGTIQTTAAGDIADGVALTNRTLVYAATTIYADANEPASLVRGLVECLADATMFAAGSLPTFGANIYSNAGGKFGTTGPSVAQLIGKVLSTTPDYRTPPNTTTSLVHMELRLGK